MIRRSLVVVLLGLASARPPSSKVLEGTSYATQNSAPRGSRFAGGVPRQVWWLAGQRQTIFAGTDDVGLSSREVFPGVRWTGAAQPRGLVYRIDVEPHGPAERLRMRYQDAQAVTVDGTGRVLVVRTEGRTLRETGLRCFQEIDGAERDVPCRYRVDDAQEVAFELGSYDRERSLVVDPVVSWSSHLGGADSEGYGIAVDSGGNVFVVGTTDSTDFPTAGGFDTSYSGAYDAFVTKVDASGSSLAWSSYLGGGGDDEGNGIAVDSGGNVYVTGDTDSTDFPTTGGFDTIFGGGLDDAFVTKVDASGSSLAWSSYLGGGDFDDGLGIAVDSGANVYVVGHTWSTDFPTPNGFGTTYGGAGDAFVTKVDASGSSLAWSSYLGGGDFDDGFGIAVDFSGNVYVTGDTDSTDFPAKGGFSTSGGGLFDAFVTKLDASGSSLAWSSYLGGGDDDYGRGIAMDSSGNVYVSGRTDSADFPTMGGFDNRGGGADAFMTKVNASGSSLAWSSYLGGSGEDAGVRIAADSSGNVYVTGRTDSTDFPTTGGFETTYGGAYDAFVTKVNASGPSLAWSSYLGGNDEDFGIGIAVDSTGNVYVTGVSGSTDFPTIDGFDTIGSGFVTRIGACGNAVCDPGETACDCPAECGADTCGNGCCGAAEDVCNCPADCGADACGNGCCGAAEDVCSCPADCTADPCGNGCCGPLESDCTCAVDCEPECGDGCCSGLETACDCSADCDATCGDTCCTGEETECTCPQDCQDACGDDCCSGGEDCGRCAEDCGACVPALDAGDHLPSADAYGCACDLGRDANSAALLVLMLAALACRGARHRKRRPNALRP